MFAKLKAIWNLASGGIVTARNVFVVLFSLATGWTKLHTMGARAVLIAVLLGIGYLFKSTLFLSGGWFVDAQKHASEEAAESAAWSYPWRNAEVSA